MSNDKVCKAVLRNDPCNRLKATDRIVVLSEGSHTKHVMQLPASHCNLASATRSNEISFLLRISILLVVSRLIVNDVDAEREREGTT